jgi:hypothetical protein
MISTVTVTTVTTIAAMGLAGTILGAAAVSTLIGFLAAKELVNTRASTVSKRISRYLSVGIVPLTMAFVVIVALTVVSILAA